MNEIINGIKVIKMYAWESSFEKLVEKARRYTMSKMELGMACLSFCLDVIGKLNINQIKD